MEEVPQRSQSEDPRSNLKNYKRNLSIKVVGVLILFFIFILERIFYPYLQKFELELMAKAQKSVGIMSNHEILPFFKTLGEYKIKS